MTNMLDIPIDLEVRANSSMIFVQGARRNIWHQIFGKLHLPSDMADDGARDLLGSWKVAELLKDLQQNHQGKFLVGATSRRTHKGDVCWLGVYSSISSFSC